MEALEDRRLLAVVTVGNNLDVVNGDTSTINALINNDGGDGISLREAITAANMTGAADSVLFDGTLAGQTISIASQLPTITGSLTINGLGANLLTIDAGNGADNTFATGDGYRIFDINDSTGTLIDVAISGLTLTGGDAARGANGNETAGSPGDSGGAIRNTENLTLTASTISGNASGGGGTGGILIGSFMGIPASIAYPGGAGGNGGGIFSSAGTLLVQSSTVSGNMTGRGGNAGIPIGTITLGSNGGNGGVGSGIHVTGGSLHVEQSTISGNLTGDGGNASSGTSGSGAPGLRGAGGGIFNNATTSVLQSTLTNNTARSGGGVFNNGGTVNVTGSIIAGNTAPSSPNLAGTLASDSFNLIDVDPLLGPLADNGGPTQTHALLLGSPAINAGDPAFTVPPDFDQRGAPFARVLGGTIDIGSFEFAPLAVVNNLGDFSDGDPFNGITTLREAVQLANANPGADVIEFDAALSGQTIALGGTQLAITEAIIIDASNLAQNVTIDAGGLSRILFIDDPGVSDEDFDVTLAGLTFTGGRTTANAQGGGAIWSVSRGDLTLSESTVTGNRTEGTSSRGGGILALGNVVLYQSVVSNNSTLGDGSSGGGIYTTGAANLTLSTVSGNSTAGQSAYGGGFLADSSLTITQSTISGNRTIGPQAKGGGFIFDGGTATLIESNISGNHTAGADAYGGGVYATAPLVLIDSTVDGNYTMGVNSPGGAIWTNRVLSITGSSISGNHTTGQSVGGGALFAAGSNVTISDSAISENFTSGDFARGGAIYSSSAGLEITRSTISGNRTEGHQADGGAIRAVLSDITISQSTVSGNKTENFRAYGGAMWVSGELLVSLSTISGNSTLGSQADGGAIFTFSNTPVTLFQSTFYDNHATGADADGGGIFVADLSQNLPIDVVGSIFAGNTATGSGDDLLPDPESDLNANHSLLGTGIIVGSGGNNVLTDNPHLGPLANNGGPTKTHALLPGSPAIDAGDTLLNPLVTPTNVTSSTVATDLRPAGKLIDGSGLTSPLTFENYATENHATVNDSNSWVTSTVGGFNDYFASNPPVDLVFSLAEQERLSDLVVWGYGGTGGPNRNEAKTFEVSFSTDSGASFHTSVVVDHLLTGVMVETISLGGAYLADTVRLRITDNHFLPPGAGGGDRVGLGEVRFIAVTSDVDQRGLPRVVDGDGVGGAQIDIGSYELQNTAAADFDSDGDVEGRDFLAWQRGFGILAPNAGMADGDADLDNDVDGADLGVWQLQYGTAPPLAALSQEFSAVNLRSSVELDSPLRGNDGALAVSSSHLSNSDLVDLALAVEWMGPAEIASELLVVEDLAEVEGVFAAEQGGDWLVADAVAAKSQAAVGNGETDEVVVQGEPWLTEKLLEKVFG